MNSKPTSKSSSHHKPVVLKDQNIPPIRLNEIATSDNSYVFMNERFKQQMKNIDQQMNKFSSDLRKLIGGTAQSTVGSTKDALITDWEAIKNSPLVVGEGEDKCLRLQFDVSQFDPTEVQVSLVNDTLTVTAHHEEVNEDNTVQREYNRQLKLPPNTNSEKVTFELSRDGVLLVQAPFTIPLQDALSDISGVSEGD